MKTLILRITVILLLFTGNNLFAQEIDYRDWPLKIQLSTVYPEKHNEFKMYTSDGIVKLEYTITVRPWQTKITKLELNLKERLEDYGWKVLSGPDGKVYDLTKEFTEKVVYRIKPKVLELEVSGLKLKIPYTKAYACIIVDNYVKQKEQRINEQQEFINNKNKVQKDTLYQKSSGEVMQFQLKNLHYKKDTTKPMLYDQNYNNLSTNYI